MPYKLETDDENKVITVQTDSTTSLTDIFAFISELMEEPYLSLPYGVLIDFRDANLKGIYVDDVNKKNCAVIYGNN